MELKKLAPWNWFKKEEEHAHAVPVQHAEKPQGVPGGHTPPMLQLHRDIDNLFGQFFAGWGMPRLGNWEGLSTDALLKPKVDLSGADNQYQLTVEIPGVEEKDISVDVRQNTMTIRGEKRQEKEEKEKNHYRIERSYGAFQRILSLPEDVDQDSIKAAFKNGVLTITMPRKALPASEVKQVAITSE
ncbi:Hsp20/alpha crystallin family protein [Desulfobulbus rhabdoformis]|uniref:Hsp20/alpha crystallin family protein n=1 Tax=Desulfobulbus rhabdoformis TaxID=34032 RepID=UPI00196357D0|nr:Hsp20/alpha crystallin family protein [Desulfobulbus rhabdoformis]MBM9616602.1 Hsp20/alpha crystallin family protein [Desulfobulbus rhabdoformis]